MKIGAMQNTPTNKSATSPKASSEHHDRCVGSGALRDGGNWVHVADAAMEGLARLGLSQQSDCPGAHDQGQDNRNRPSSRVVVTAVLDERPGGKTEDRQRRQEISGHLSAHLCGGGEFGPDRLPIVRAKIASRYNPLRRSFNGEAALNGHWAFSADPVGQVRGVRTNLQGEAGLGSALLLIEVVGKLHVTYFSLGLIVVNSFLRIVFL